MRELFEGVRLAVGTLTVLPVGTVRADRRIWTTAMTAAPLVGLLVGGIAAGAQYGARQLWGDQFTGALIAGVLTIVALALVSGGLHIDGLADTADALGAQGDPARRRSIMRDSHVGPFGMVAVLLVMTTQVFAQAHAIHFGLGVLSVLVASTTGRVVVAWLCTPLVRAARPDGLGAQVARTVGVGPALAMTVAMAGLLAVIGYASDGGEAAARSLGAVGAGLAAAAGLAWLATRRIGGVTGDVLGAAVELATAAALLAMTITV